MAYEEVRQKIWDILKPETPLLTLADFQGQQSVSQPESFTWNFLFSYMMIFPLKLGTLSEEDNKPIPMIDGKKMAATWNDYL